MLPFPSQGGFLHPAIEPMSPALQADSFTTEPPGSIQIYKYIMVLFIKRKKKNDLQRVTKSLKEACKMNLDYDRPHPIPFFSFFCVSITVSASICLSLSAPCGSFTSVFLLFSGEFPLHRYYGYNPPFPSNGCMTTRGFPLRRNFLTTHLSIPTCYTPTVKGIKNR